MDNLIDAELVGRRHLDRAKEELQTVRRDLLGGADKIAFAAACAAVATAEVAMVISRDLAEIKKMLQGDS